MPQTPRPGGRLRLGLDSLINGTQIKKGSIPFNRLIANSIVPKGDARVVIKAPKAPAKAASNGSAHAAGLEGGRGVGAARTVLL